MKFLYSKADELSKQYQVELTNERGQREWLYLVSKMSDSESWITRCIKLLGNKKRYPLNFARLLEIELPQESELPLLESAQEARRATNQKNICNIKRMLGKRV